MIEYQLYDSQYLKNENNIPYDVVLYENKFFCGRDLFKNFTYYLQKNWDAQVNVFTDSITAEKHLLNIIG